jgi:hypothetical protein
VLVAITWWMAANACFAAERTQIDLPPVMLWAWERPEDLSFLNAQEIGVAYLSQTITLSDRNCHIRRRVQPLKLPEAAKVCAVTRIEIDARHRAAYAQRQADLIVRSITTIARTHKIEAVQIDFDARSDERQFYAGLLRQLRAALPPQVGLSITALASWCLYDRWLAELPVDEAVPMMFRMGRDHGKVLLHFQGGRGFAHPICRQSLGVSLDEPAVNSVMEKVVAEQKTPPRIYVFSPRRWTKEDAHRAVQFASPKRGS